MPENLECSRADLKGQGLRFEVTLPNGENLTVRAAKVVSADGVLLFMSRVSNQPVFMIREWSRCRLLPKGEQ